MHLYIKNQLIKKIVVAATIAALYVVLTAVSAAFGLSYSGVQFRLSEALTILPVFSPYAITGLTLGCFISNLASPLGVADVIFGTLSTFIAAHLTRKLAKITYKNIPILAPLPPVVIGAVFIGAILAFLLPDGFSIYAFALSALSVGIGETVVCYGLGLPLYFWLKKMKIFEDTE